MSIGSVVVIGIVCVFVGIVIGLVGGDWCDSIDREAFRDYSDESNLSGL
mgnify:CR=1 FL=1